MYTQNLNIKSNCENAKYKEFPNKSAIEHMQIIKYCQNNTENNQKTNNFEQTIEQNRTCKDNSSEILMPIILSMIFSDCNIDNNDIFTILLCSVLTL